MKKSFDGLFDQPIAKRSPQGGGYKYSSHVAGPSNRIRHGDVLFYCYVAHIRTIPTLRFLREVPLKTCVLIDGIFSLPFPFLLGQNCRGLGIFFTSCPSGYIDGYKP